ncbi:hypothetical protein Pan216_27430 [Planctomycetes bacterium Pan216]|uniref:Putative restriction endonuclease domain-containing protein n=1 Tax=Kolteria novifilia TaxID=2527975 RepID=A0A518B4H7_9BACT|nr:hypothetical protein Pan216_27430 [Planctomycetes bacterium Pan216]
MSTETRPITAEQLFAEHAGERTELVAGEPTAMTPVGITQSLIVGALNGMIWNHINGRRLPVIVGPELGFVLRRNPDTVRAPDLAVLRVERLTDQQSGFFEGAPDLAIEVLSPHDKPAEVERKIREFLDAGTEVAWVVDPESRTVSIHRGDESVVRLDPNASLDGGELLPGFTCSIANIFAKPGQQQQT